MKQILLMCAVLVGGCGGKKEAESPTVEIADPILEEAIRKELFKQEGELTQADLEKVKELSLANNRITDVESLEKLTNLKELTLKYNQLTSVKGLEKLTQLKKLNLDDNPALTKAQIDELQKALPKCDIKSNPTK